MKKLKQWIAATMIIGSVLALPTRAAESASVLLQKGIFAEETEGNLDAAIKIYEQIAAETAANRAVVAQAQYRLAVCYQKKGNKVQAIKLLNELVQQFPSDVTLTQKARATLTELGAISSQGVSIRKISLPEAGWPEAISQDGRFVAYEPTGGYDLAVCEVATGKTWMIAKCGDGKSPGGVELSPDGQRIAFDLSGPIIYIAKFDGAEKRTLYESDDKTAYVWPLRWSRDSSHLTVVLEPKTGSRRLIDLDVTTGDKREMARMPDKANTGSWSLSTDNDYLAHNNGAYPRKITLLDLKSGREEIVVDRDAVRLVGWAPGDSKLLYSKNGIGGVELWAIGIKDGKRSGDPEFVWGKFEGVSLDITRNGNIYYMTRKTKDEAGGFWVMEGFLATKPPVTPIESWRIQTDIPTDEMILGSDNSMLDRKFDFGATFPKGWAISSAVRQGNGGTVIQFTSYEIREANAQPRIIYWPTTPWENPGSAANDFAKTGPKPTTPAEIDAWLRKRLQTMLEATAKNGDNMTKIDRSVSKIINGHHALTAIGSYTRNGKSWSQILTEVYSDNLLASCQVRVPTETLDAIQPTYERLADTIRLP